MVAQRYRTQQKDSFYSNGLTRRPLGCKNFLHALCRSKAVELLMTSGASADAAIALYFTLCHSQLVQVIQVSQLTAEQCLLHLPAISRRNIDHSSDVSGRGRTHVPQRGDTAFACQDPGDNFSIVQFTSLSLLVTSVQTGLVLHNGWSHWR